MKKISFVFCICIFTLLSCASTSAKNKETLLQNNNNDSEIFIINNDNIIFQNHSFLNEDNNGNTVTVSGILKKDETFYITENPESKSRVTFLIQIKNSEDISLCTSFINKKVHITGILTDASSPWEKSISFISISE